MKADEDVWIGRIWALPTTAYFPIAGVLETPARSTTERAPIGAVSNAPLRNLLPGCNSCRVGHCEYERQKRVGGNKPCRAHQPQFSPFPQQWALKWAFWKVLAS